MSRQSIEKFREYLENQKDDFLRDGRRVEGIIRDIFPEEKSLISLLTNAWRAGVVAELKQTANLEVTISQFADRLSQEYSLRESPAFTAVRVWAYVLGVTDVIPNINVSSTPSSGSPPNTTSDTKKCPFCAEEVKKDARKCKHCHSDISDDTTVKGVQSNELMRQQEALQREKQKQQLERERQEVARLKTLEAEREKQKSERERQEFEKMAALEAERKKLEAERNELADKKKRLTSGSQPAISTAKETGRDGRFIAYDNGTVLDTRTGLMWAAKRNGSLIKWANAKNYCDNYRGGGYTDWRMPTQDELAELDASGAHNGKVECNGKQIWASETRGSEAAYFGFSSGKRYWARQSHGYCSQALPVRCKSAPTMTNGEAQQKKLEAQRSELELSKTQFATTPSSAHISAKETARDGRFIAYDNGSVLDTRTNLMWASKDNGEGIKWKDAKCYCENYRGGGYTDWRMPTQDELGSLYDKSKRQKIGWLLAAYLTEFIKFTHLLVWGIETRGSDAANFNFGNGTRAWGPQSSGLFSRVLPVRSGK